MGTGIGVAARGKGVAIGEVTAPAKDIGGWAGIAVLRLLDGVGRGGRITSSPLSSLSSLSGCKRGGGGTLRLWRCDIIQNRNDQKMKDHTRYKLSDACDVDRKR